MLPFRTGLTCLPKHVYTFLSFYAIQSPSAGSSDEDLAEADFSVGSRSSKVGDSVLNLQGMFCIVGFDFIDSCSI